MNKRLYLYFLIALGVVILAIVLTALLSPKKQTPQVENPIGKQLAPTPYQSAVDLPQNQKKYTNASSLISRSNSVVTDSNNTVIYQQTVFLAPNTKLPSISAYTTQYGNPEKEITGSKYYGISAVTMIYASKGITIIGNPNTKEVYELQQYVPMSVEGYIQAYGQDISENMQNPEAL
jgi:hypothetical protein